MSANGSKKEGILSMSQYYKASLIKKKKNNLLHEGDYMKDNYKSIKEVEIKLRTHYVSRAVNRPLVKIIGL